MSVAQRAIDSYFRLAHVPALGRAHNAYRRVRNRLRYGVDSAWMFQVVELEVNSMCNRRCHYCPNSTSRRPPGYMKEGLFRKILGELGAMGYDGRLSYHFYGEPLLDKRLPGFVARSRRELPRAELEVFTNGDLLTLETFRELVGLGLDLFLVTQHDNVVPENLEEILATTTPAEREHLSIRFARDRELINRSGLIETLGKPDETLRLPCDWPLSDMVITLQGNVVLCCNDYFETEVVGNVAESSLREVWASPRFDAFRQALATGNRTASKLCVNCDYRPAPERISRIIAG
jgi:radical SAM protein with 4Fe4S-binding SPASM domain